MVTTAHHTRLRSAQREQLVLERDALDIEWRNLILEENARSATIAGWKDRHGKPNQHVDPSQENIECKIRIETRRMKAAAKTQKPKRQEEHANFISWRFALLCGCILLALAFLLGRVAWLQVISPDMLVKEGDMRSCSGSFHLPRHDNHRPFWSPVSGERAGKSDLG